MILYNFIRLQWEIKLNNAHVKEVQFDCHNIEMEYDKSDFI